METGKLTLEEGREIPLIRNLLVPVYSIGVIGALLQIAGGYWDVSWHTLGLVETFFTAPHMILYAGVALVLLSAGLGLLMRLTFFRDDASRRPLLTGLLIAVIGGGFQVIAGPFDFWWHSQFGFDPFLFTPSHALLILGIILNGFGMAMGSARLLQAHGAKLGLGTFLVSSRWLQLLVVLALTALWLDLNALVYLLTDVDGLAYTFQLGTGFVGQTSSMAFISGIILVAATGTLVLFSAKSILRWTGAVTAVALISATISATANLGFRAWTLVGSSEGTAIASFIPLYLSFVIPVLVFDLLVKDLQSMSRTLLAAALVSPFASYLDGWYSVALWLEASQLIPILIAPILVAGLVAGGSRLRFADALLSQEIGTTRTS